nr:T9SS type A sorting domain-containing protein [Bacteroidota bacterium]
MKKALLFGMVAIVITTILSGQQVQNPGFEDWEDAGTVIDEPVNWSSIKTSDGGDWINDYAPVVWGQSNDAHTGNYSVELINVQTIVLATGTITNGRVHAEVVPSAGFVYTDPTDERWHTVLTGRPDSVAIWVKYAPQGMDTAQVQVLLHKGDGSLPPKPENQANMVGFAQINVTGTVGTWTRYVIPFTYYNEDNPEYILIILTAGAGLQAIEGSKAWYDDMELIYGPSGIGEITSREILIYASGSTVLLDKLPQNYLNDATMEILNLNGSVIFSTPVTTNKVNINRDHLPQGLYLVRIWGRETSHTQKIYLK